MRKHTLFLMLLSITIGCNSEKKTDTWDKENTRDVEVGDTVYTNAINKAKQNLPVFLESLSEQNRRKDYEYYVKTSYTDENEVEHMWFIVDSLKKKSLIGILNNVPLKLKNIKLNDKLEIQFDEIEDWIIYKGDTVVAGDYIGKSIQ